MEFQLNNVSIRLKSGKQIISQLNFLLNKNDKLAIIGEEGNGKSTLIKYIYNSDLIDTYCYYEGVVNTFSNKIGYLRQNIQEDYNNISALTFLLMDDNNQINYELYKDYYKIERLFNDFNLDLQILENNRKIKTLSGGEKVKLQLIKLLINNVGVLLLDEPTNDIDLNTLIWLENFVKSTDIPVIFVSHDQEFLRKTANIILHIEQIKSKTQTIHTLRKCSYDEYLEFRKIKFFRQDNAAYQQKKMINAKKEVLRKFKNKLEHQMILAVRQPTWGRLLAKKMKVVTSSEKKLDKLEKIEYSSKEEEINVSFSKYVPLISNDKMILNIQDYELKIDSKILCKDINLTIKGPEHIVIVGNNGVGKTTLIKEILRRLQEVPSIAIGYFPQNYDELLDLESNVVTYLSSTIGSDKDSITKIMTYLSAVNFLEDELNYKIKELSSGQRAKVLLLKIILEKSNVLVLDEPTRNLSPLSSPKICEILSDFKGVIISVSHDRSYINQVCDKAYSLNEEGLELVSSNNEFD